MPYGFRWQRVSEIMNNCKKYISTLQLEKKENMMCTFVLVLVVLGQMGILLFLSILLLIWVSFFWIEIPFSVNLKLNHNKNY